MPTFTPHQDEALKAVAGWMKSKPGERGANQVFRLFGYAGTGKTTLARHIAAEVDGEVKFAAFTGKAALVMRRKGCGGASTIHSLIYRARESGEETPTFDLWDDSPAARAALIVIDECSMVDAELGRDLLSFGVPVLVLGDSLSAAMAKHPETFDEVLDIVDPERQQAAAVQQQAAQQQAAPDPLQPIEIQDRSPAETLHAKSDRHRRRPLVPRGTDPRPAAGTAGIAPRDQQLDAARDFAEQVQRRLDGLCHLLRRVSLRRVQRVCPQPRYLRARQNQELRSRREICLAGQSRIADRRCLLH